MKPQLYEDFIKTSDDILGGYKFKYTAKYQQNVVAAGHKATLSSMLTHKLAKGVDFETVADLNLNKLISGLKTKITHKTEGEVVVKTTGKDWIKGLTLVNETIYGKVPSSSLETEFRAASFVCKTETKYKSNRLSFMMAPVYRINDDYQIGCEIAGSSLVSCAKDQDCGAKLTKGAVQLLWAPAKYAHHPEVVAFVDNFGTSVGAWFCQHLDASEKTWMAARIEHEVKSHKTSFEAGVEHRANDKITVKGKVVGKALNLSMIAKVSPTVKLTLAAEVDPYELVSDHAVTRLGAQLVVG